MTRRAILFSTLAICAVAPIAQITFYCSEQVEIDVKRADRKPASKGPFALFTIGTFSVVAAAAWAWRKHSRKASLLFAVTLVLGGLGVYVFGNSWYGSLRRPIPAGAQSIADFLALVQFLAALLFVAGLKIIGSRRSQDPVPDT